MPWTSTAGLAGKVYLPDDVGQAPKKHACKDCFSCQWCDEIRCQVCRNDTDVINSKLKIRFSCCQRSPSKPG